MSRASRLAPLFPRVRSRPLPHDMRLDYPSAQNNAYSAQNNAYSAQNNAYSAQNSAYPAQNLAYSAQNFTHSAPNHAYPPQNLALELSKSILYEDADSIDLKSMGDDSLWNGKPQQYFESMNYGDTAQSDDNALDAEDYESDSLAP